MDFRELVRDLAAEFHLRVDMRQIGVRDEARMIGGLGHCGEQLCCVRFGGEFQPVSIRMAKEQDLPLNPLKISGLCGRLMCCLRYEYDAYKDFKGRAPKKGAIIDVGGSLAKVVELNTPRELVTMRKEDGTRVTVALADMECCEGAGCPCSVKAEALERSMAALGHRPGRLVRAQPRARASCANRPAARDAAREPRPARPRRRPARAPSEARRQPSRRSGARRRRGGGGGRCGRKRGQKAPRHAGEAGQGAVARGRQPKPPAGDAGPRRPARAGAAERRRARLGRGGRRSASA